MIRGAWEKFGIDMTHFIKMPHYEQCTMQMLEFGRLKSGTSSAAFSYRELTTRQAFHVQWLAKKLRKTISF